MAISSWLNFGRPAAPPGTGSGAGRKLLAPAYYSQHAMFASPPSAFFISGSRRVFPASHLQLHCYTVTTEPEEPKERAQKQHKITQHSQNSNTTQRKHSKETHDKIEDSQSGLVGFYDIRPENRLSLSVLSTRIPTWGHWPPNPQGDLCTSQKKRSTMGITTKDVQTVYINLYKQMWNIVGDWATTCNAISAYPMLNGSLNYT